MSYSFTSMEHMTGLEIAILGGYYVSTLGFLVATVMMAIAVRQFGASTFGEIFLYFVVGTATFFAVTIFQTLGGSFFRISPESVDVWWHIMFYIAMISYYRGLRSLVALGGNDGNTSSVPWSLAVYNTGGIIWSASVAAALLVIFIVPHSVEPYVLWYLDSPLGAFGWHHFLAFILAGVVGWYLFRARRTLGPVGVALSFPLLVTIWALSFQHLWELQFESWKTVHVSHDVGEGGEKIFLTVAGIGVAFAAWRLYALSRRLFSTGHYDRPRASVSIKEVQALVEPEDDTQKS